MYSLASPGCSRDATIGIVSHAIFRQPGKMLGRSYLVAVLAIEQDPAQFYDFRRVLGHIYAMFVTGCSHMDDHVSVQLGDWDCVTGHVGGCVSRKVLGVIVSQTLGARVSVKGRSEMWCGDIPLNASSHFSKPAANE